MSGSSVTRRRTHAAPGAAGAQPLRRELPDAAVSGGGTTTPAAIGRTHTLLRGGFAAVVFSGDRRTLGELAGEATARIPCKFVACDPTLSAGNDLARSAGGATLATWPLSEVRPIDGVCFVLSSSTHPALRALLANGAQVNEHFVLTTGLAQEDAERALQQRLAKFLASASATAPLVVLGYGHQGRRIADSLRRECDVSLGRIAVWDSSADSIARARSDGFAIVDAAAVRNAAAVIGSPLAPYERIQSMLATARAAGIPVFDNADRTTGLRQWRSAGRVALDEAAHRALRVDDAGTGDPKSHESSAKNCRVCCRDASLRPLLTVHVVREDQCLLAGVVLPHLISGQCHAQTDENAMDLAVQWIGDGLASHTYKGLRRAFLALHDRAELGFFAARELALELWPSATRRIFPSEHVLDLGVTAFERLLRAQLDAREMVSTMQTPAQRVALGAAAAHYAADRPIIEIGSALGGSMLHMAAATSQGSRAALVSVDPDAPTRDIMRFALEREGHADRLQQVVKSSDDALAELPHLRGGCGLIFVDGLHTFDAVFSDFRNYATLVAPGGVLAFHDVCPAIHSVMQAIVEHVLPDRRFVAKCLVDGLLVLERITRDA